MRNYDLIPQHILDESGAISRPAPGVLIPADLSGRRLRPALPQGSTVVTAPGTPVPVQVVSPDGFDFRDAVVGAAVALAVVLLAAAALLLTRKRGHPARV